MRPPMDGMQRIIARHRLDAHRFVLRMEGVFVTRANGNGYPRWRGTLRNAIGYVDGLLTAGKGKTMRALARRVNLPHDRLEGFVRDSPWGYEAVQEGLVFRIPEAVRSERAVLVVDEVGIPKKGRYSVGVARQYCGETGKVENCQVAADLVYALPSEGRNADQVTWPLGMRLYLPKAWFSPDYGLLWEEGGIPDDVAFQTKPEIAGDLLEGALDAGVPYRCVVGDAVYGDGGGLRRRLREREAPYVLGINPSKHRFTSEDAAADNSVADDAVWTAAEAADRADWTRVVWGEGTDGPLEGDFHMERARVVRRDGTRWAATEEAVTLLLERRSNERKAYVAWGLEDVDLEGLVKLAHSRWTIEQFHRETKQQMGLGDFQGRTWNGWHHHASLVLLAHAFVAMLRAEAGEEGVNLPPFPQVFRAFVLEAGVQAAMEEGLGRPEAERAARALYRRWLA